MKPSYQNTKVLMPGVPLSYFLSEEIPEVPLMQYVKFNPRIHAIDLSLRKVYIRVIYNQASTGLELMIPLKLLFLVGMWA